MLDEPASAGQFDEVSLGVGDLVAQGDEVGVGQQGLEAATIVGVEDVVVAGDESLPRGGGGVVGLAQGRAG